jgi:Flp pilus assembly protein TadG
VTGQRGSAVVGFVGVVVPLVALVLGVLQAVAWLRVRDVVAAAAAEGARWAAASGRSPADGGPVAERILARSPVAGRVSCTGWADPRPPGTVLVTVRCTGPVPRSPLHVTTTASAFREHP